MHRFNLTDHAGTYFDDGDGGGGTGDGDAGTGDGGDGDKGSRTFTQTEVDELVETRLAREKRISESARSKLLQKYETEMEEHKGNATKLKEITAERDALLKEGQTENQALREKHKRDLTAATDSAESYKAKFEKSETRRRKTEIKNTLADVSATFLKEKVKPSAFFKQFRDCASFEPELDDDGKPTGEEVLILTYDVADEDGEKSSKTFTDAGKWMDVVYADPDNDFLFSGNPASGSGADSTAGRKAGTKKAFYTRSELKRLKNDTAFMADPVKSADLRAAVKEGRIREG